MVQLKSGMEKVDKTMKGIMLVLCCFTGRQIFSNVTALSSFFLYMLHSYSLISLRCIFCVLQRVRRCRQTPQKFSVFILRKLPAFLPVIEITTLKDVECLLFTFRFIRSNFWKMFVPTYKHSMFISTR